jgi:hypothetical protein
MAMKCPACSADVPDAIPKERFNEVNTKKNQLESENKLLAAQATKAEQLEQELTSTRERHSTDLALIDAGITDADVRAVVELAHSRLPAGEDGAKPAVKDWVSTWKENPAAVPPIVRPFLQQAGKAPGAAPGSQATSQAAPPPKKGEATTAGASGAPAAFQAGSLREIRRSQGLDAAKAHLETAKGALGPASSPKSSPTDGA